jgi:hypothetical protein
MTYNPEEESEIDRKPLRATARFREFRLGKCYSGL